MTKMLLITNCTQCPHHSVIRDPDPFDSFCSDDVAVVCTKTPHDYSNRKEWWWKENKFRAITSGCRPYNTEIESVIPSW